MLFRSIGFVAGLELDGRVGEHGADDEKNHERDPAGDEKHVRLRTRHRALGEDRRLMAVHDQPVRDRAQMV